MIEIQVFYLTASLAMASIWSVTNGEFGFLNIYNDTMRPRSLGTFYIVSYYTTWVKTSAGCKLCPRSGVNPIDPPLLYSSSTKSRIQIEIDPGLYLGKN